LSVLPGEVEDLFLQIIEKIPKQDRREAWAIFAIKTATKELPANQQPSLLKYSYLRGLDKATGF